MEKKRIGIIITVLILALMASYYYKSKELYGNDKESILKVIKSIDDYKDKEINILEINDFKDVRIVGFLSNNSPSYIGGPANISEILYAKQNSTQKKPNTCTLRNLAYVIG